MAISTGGVVSNTGLALHRLGANVRLMATVGDDPLGRLIIAALNERDAALSQSIGVRPGQPSSYSIVLSPAHADRTFLHCTGHNDTFGIKDVDFALLESARLFHLGYPPLLPRLMADDGAELEQLFRRAKATGVVTSLDMTLPDPNGPSGQVNWRKCLERTMPYVDIFVPSIEEILFMLRRPDFETWRGEIKDHLTARYLADLAEELLSMGGVIVGFKLGSMGFYLHTARRLDRLTRLALPVSDWAAVRLFTPAYTVEVVTTLGAGDSAYAGFLAALLRGLSPAEAARMACAAGACNVEAADATSGVRTWEATRARMAAGWPTRDEGLPD
jgi:sugar/nucleoside kinase (ribokinase family)